MGAPTGYARIVADLRAEIEAGRLRPGDRVPSTRAMTRRWGVAMATATKALTTLRREGLVQAVPGVGSVVATPHRHPTRPAAARPAPAELGLEVIVAAAVEVADADGLAALSMRRVATALGAAPMSLYRHVSDKDDLLLRMLDAVFGAEPFPVDVPGTWRARLEGAAELLWGSFRRHPWAASALSLTRPQPIPSGMAFTDWVLAGLDGSGLSDTEQLTAYLTLVNYVRGTALNLEADADAEAATGMDADTWVEAQSVAYSAILAAGGLTQLSRRLGQGYDFDLDVVFRFGLRMLLDGIEREITLRAGH